MRRKYRIIGNRVKIPDDPVTVIRENSRKKPLSKDEKAREFEDL